MTSFEIISTLVGSGLIIGIFKLIFTCGKICQKLDGMARDLYKASKDIEGIKSDIKNIDSRLNRLEAAFTERGQWESKIYKIERNFIEPHE